MRLAATSVAALTAARPIWGRVRKSSRLRPTRRPRVLAAPEASWPEETWWKAYGDPQLDGLIDEALKDSPDLKMAAARVRAAEAMADISEAMLWPTIVGDGTLMETA